MAGTEVTDEAYEASLHRKGLTITAVGMGWFSGARHPVTGDGLVAEDLSAGGG